MKISIYAGRPLAALLEDHENRSGRINAVADRYLGIVEHHAPEMTEAEWCAVCDALNGYWITDRAGVRAMWAEIYDGDRINGLGEKWGADAIALAERVREMPFAELVALAEVVERFWQHAELPTADGLAKAGARIRIDAGTP